MEKNLNQNKPLFCVAGFPVNFFESKYKNSREKIFDWLNELDLDGLELQCTYGFRMSYETAQLYNRLSKEKGIVLTVHAPYYINLGSKRSEVVQNSKRDLIKGIELSKLLGAKKLIFHPGGGFGKTEKDRKNAIAQIIEVLNQIENEIDVGNVCVSPEIGGKTNSLGSLDEVIEICKNVNFAFPCIDIAHLHAREIGSLTNVESIENVLNKIEQELGRETLEKTHFHMYPVEFTKMGEKVHKAFGDLDENGNEFLPRAEDFVRAIKIKGLLPSVVSETHNTQEIGAKILKKLFFEIKV